MQLFFYLNAFKPSPKPDLTFVAGGLFYKSALKMNMQGYTNAEEVGLVPGDAEGGRASAGCSVQPWVDPVALSKLLWVWSATLVWALQTLKE